jgi:hypothetical protein
MSSKSQRQAHRLALAAEDGLHLVDELLQQVQVDGVRRVGNRVQHGEEPEVCEGEPAERYTGWPGWSQ